MATDGVISRAAPVALLSLLLAALCYSERAGAVELSVIDGRVVDQRNGLPVAGATILLVSRGVPLARTQTGPDGTFKLKASPGTYSIRISARQYEEKTLTGLVVTAGTPEIAVRTALARGEHLETIAHVATDVRSVARSSTVTESVNPQAMQQQDILRVGDLLGTLPGVTANGSSSSVGDDEDISIRGFDPTETATLLDGHPIGPIGAQGAGYNYAVSPFWGLREATVTFGSGATGLYGVSTVAGAVNFVTLDPTRKPYLEVSQGVGNDGQLLSGLVATGTFDKLGYALAFAVQGTEGEFAPQFITQQGLLASDARGFPNVTPANIAANTYAIAGSYLLRNDLAKFSYDLDPKTKLEGTFYAATSWTDHTGNGDNDFNPYSYNFYEYQLALAQSSTTHVRLPNGEKGVCHDSIAFLNDSSQLFGCYTPSEAAAMIAGPAGGGPNSYAALLNQDYHLRVTRTIGITQLLVDGFVDNYAENDYSPPSAAVGGFSSDYFLTHGYLIADQVPLSKNELSYGLYFQHQAHTGDTFNQATNIVGKPLSGIVPNQEFGLTSTSYFLSDQWTPNLRSSGFADLWFQHSNNTRVTNFDPRLAYVYRPTVNDTLRLSGGHSYSEPDPALLYAFPTLNSDVSGFNPVCGAAELNPIGAVSDPNLLPETATDIDLTYAHRLAQGVDLQADVYRATEWNALLSGNLPLSQTGFSQIPAALVDRYLRKIDAFCHRDATPANLAVTTTYNAGQEKYSGVVLSVNARLTRFLDLTADYNIQSASYFNLPPNVLQNNLTFVDGTQIVNVPLHTANVGLSGRSGAFSGTFDSHYFGPNNTLNRYGYWYANASLSLTRAPFSVTLGINNVFNSVASNYGYVGLGVFQPENQYGTDRNSYDQGTELFGLPYRSFRFVFTFAGP